MVKLLKATKLSVPKTQPSFQKVRHNQKVMGGSVTRMNAIRRKTFKVSLPHGLDQSLLRNGIPLLLQGLEELAHVGWRRTVFRGWA